MTKQRQVEAEVPVELDPFESITRIKTSFLGGQCPFRGLPFRPELDARCPTSLKCIALPVVARVQGAEAEVLAHVTPVLELDSYCHTCVHEQVREQEEGRAVSAQHQRPSIPGKRGRRR